MPGNPVKLSDVGPIKSDAPPALGGHTNEIRARFPDASR
jgi:hypothetical protein